MRNKLTSRKFWICIAAMTASIASSISGLQSNNTTVVTIGVVCGVMSAAIYAFCEAWVDGKAVDSTMLEEEDEDKNIIHLIDLDKEE